MHNDIVASVWGYQVNTRGFQVQKWVRYEYSLVKS